MKIEKINENQIRCTLNQGDLQERQLSLPELAYGTEKARRLFQEMLQRAMTEVGFDADDFPLMIEAIPLSSEGIMLIITKIDDPEELDTRFAKFAPLFEEELGPDAEWESDELPGPADAEDILEALSNLLAAHTGQAPTAGSEVISGTDDDKEAGPANLARTFLFRSLDEIMEAAVVLAPVYHGENTLYRNPQTGDYCLVAHKSDHTPEEFNRICNVLIEYADRLRGDGGAGLYFEEHFEPIVRDTAIQSLGMKPVTPAEQV